MTGGAGCLLWMVHSTECLLSQQAKKLHGAAQQEIRMERAEGQWKARTTFKKRNRVIFQALNYRQLKAGVSCNTFKAWQGRKLLLTLHSLPHTGLLEKTFLKYLLFSSSTVPYIWFESPSIYCTNHPAGISVQKLQFRWRTKQRMWGRTEKGGDILPPCWPLLFCSYNKQCSLDWLADWLQGISECWRSTVASFWSNPLPSNIHNILIHHV